MWMNKSNSMEIVSPEGDIACAAFDVRNGPRKMWDMIPSLFFAGQWRRRDGADSISTTIGVHGLTPSPLGEPIDEAMRAVA